MTEAEKPPVDQPDTPEESDSQDVADPAMDESETPPAESEEVVPPLAEPELPAEPEEVAPEPEPVIVEPEPPAAPSLEEKLAMLAAVQGTTIIANGIVAKIASLAAREVAGVYRLVGGGSFSEFAQRVTGSEQSAVQGVQTEVGQQEAAIYLRMITMYGVNITDLAQTVRHRVIDRVKEMTGLVVKEVSIEIVDLYFPTASTNGKGHGDSAETSEHAESEPAGSAEA